MNDKKIHPVIHRAGYVIPVTRPVIRNGGVLTDHEHVLACGPFAELYRDFPRARVIDHGSGVLLPGLINAHIHLELSHLYQLGRQPFIGSFPGWIMQLIRLREKFGAENDDAKTAALNVLVQQYSDGVVVMLDIGNTLIGQALAGQTPVQLLAYREHLGFTGSRLQQNLDHLDKQSELIFCSAHAPYSTHIDLIAALKNRADRLGHVFPLHVAESRAESTMFREGAGEMVEFLRQRGFWDDAFTARAGDFPTPVAFLAANGVLDGSTLCVHCVQVNDEDIALLAQTGAHVCLCPGSNRFLEVGSAPVEKFVKAGILPALGTDSPASNPEISLWREMTLLAEEHPRVPASTIVAMATLGGAQALGVEREYGCIAEGQKTHLLYVSLPGANYMDDELYEYLVHGNRNIKPEHASARGM